MLTCESIRRATYRSTCKSPTAIRAAVAAGVYRPGEVLPSLRAMATEVHVNPNTVQRAYDELEREGLIYSQRGRGLFVAERGDVGPIARRRRRPPGVG